MNRKRWLLPLIAIFLSFPSFLALFQSQQYITGHDFLHPARLFALHEGVMQGVFYPRWVDVWGFGFGYPLFNFYPPLFYYTALPFVFLTGSYVTAIKIALAIFVVIGALASYLLGKKLTNPLGGIATSLAFSYFGYRALTIYVRGAFAEFAAASFLPISFYFILKLTETQSKRNIALLAVSIAAIALSHQIIALPFIIFSGVWITMLLISDRKNLKEKIFSLAASFSMGLGISAFFWLPAIFEKKYTFADTFLISESFSFEQHFVYPIQLWFSAWGFGGSTAGLSDAMSFQLGKFYILAALFSVTWLFIKKAGGYSKDAVSKYMFVVFLTLLSIFLTLEMSLSLWKILPLFSYLQFPWRMFSFTAVWISILVGYFAVAGYEILKSIRISSNISSLIVFLVIGLGVIRQVHYFQPQSFVSQHEDELVSYEEIAWKVSAIAPDFTPAEIKTKKNEFNSTVVDIEKKLVIPRKEFSTSQENNIKLLSADTAYRKKIYNVALEEESQITFHTFNFPGWKAYIDNTPTTINDNNDYKLISLSVPKGTHTIKLIFTNTPVRTISWIISALSIAVLGYILYIHKPKHA